MTVQRGREVIEAEIAALQSVRDRIGDGFSAALAMLGDCRGRIIACGVGKAGIIAQKIAATLASTGSPSFFLHPADALHGDLGMVREGDVALALSNSGESEEIVKLLPYLRRLGAGIVAVTASERSTLASLADVVLPLGDIAEACPLGLAPTATTTAMLALGDALALCLMDRRGFRVEDYAERHPAGSLGRKAQPIEAVMRVGEHVAAVGPDAPVRDAMLAITRARSGAAVVLDGERRVLGIFTDGDLRRGLEADADFLHKPVRAAMTAGGYRAPAGLRAGEVLEAMTERRIGEAPVVDPEGRLLGVADLKGLLAAL